MHYGRCASARAEIQRQALGIRLAVADQRLTAIVPRLLDLSTLDDGVALVVQTRLPGKPSAFDWRSIDQATEFWLCENLKGAGTARQRLEEELSNSCAAFPTFNSALRPAADSLLEWHSSSKLPADLTHGDFWLGNILWTGEKITGIVDWEWGRTDGMRILDILHLVLMSRAISHGTSVIHYFHQVWKDDITEPDLAERLGNLCRRFHMDRDGLKFLALLLWFDYLHQKTVRARPTDFSWINETLPRSIHAMEAWLRRRPKASESFSGGLFHSKSTGRSIEHPNTSGITKPEF